MITKQCFLPESQEAPTPILVRVTYFKFLCCGSCRLGFKCRNKPWMLNTSLLRQTIHRTGCTMLMSLDNTQQFIQTLVYVKTLDAFRTFITRQKFTWLYVRIGFELLWFSATINGMSDSFISVSNCKWACSMWYGGISSP